MDAWTAENTLLGAFGQMRAGHRTAGIEAALPVLPFLNTELQSVSRGLRDHHISMHNLPITTSQNLLLLSPQGFHYSALDSVICLGWQKWLKEEDHRTFIGQLVREGKQYSHSDHRPDPAAVHALAALVSMVVMAGAAHGHVNMLVAMPSSETSTNRLPRMVTAAAGLASGIPIAPPMALTRVRQVGPMKEKEGIEEKLASIAGAVAADPATFRGQHVMIVDDLLGSGATMREAARAIRAAGADQVFGLAMAKTRMHIRETMYAS